jgi:hypothetical protein
MLTGENVAWVLLAGAFEWCSIRLMLTATYVEPESAGLRPTTSM